MTPLIDILPTLLHDVRVEIESNTSTTVSSACSLPPSFVGFQGHFPHEPILPAVIQLALVRCLAEQALNKELIPASYERTKFKSIIKPDQNLFISLNFSKRQNTLKGKFTICTDDSKTASSGTFAFSIL